MSYNRKIFYMSFYENNEKKGNAGFVKVIEKKDTWEAQVCLSGLPVPFDGEGVLEVEDGKICLGREALLLQGGGATAQYGWEKKGELCRLTFRLKLSEECMLSSGDIMNSEQPSSFLQEREVSLPVQERMPPVEEVFWHAPEVVEQQDAEEEDVEKFVEWEVKEEMPVQNSSEKEKVENRKWKQICKVYPHIRPFDDFREYIKLELRDMVLISEKKYSLVENSFLLHGYYNYGHLILWRKDKAPVKYYVGVPGNFYDKEKQVAVLYGFESFEGGVEPAKEGDFGYYMTEVSL